LGQHVTRQANRAAFLRPLDDGNGFDKAQRDNCGAIKDQVVNVEAFG
jgi:hypothetical protein